MNGNRGLWSVVSITLFAATSMASATNQYSVILERNVATVMRDGVTLRADIYRPDADGRFPVLLQRTPYNKDDMVQLGMEGAAKGYVVIIQDVRGSYASDGEWYPFKHESDDGYDTVEWAAGLPYSNEKVGMFGGSYVGATQMLAAIAHPPHLAGICPAVTASNYHDGWVYQGGAFEQWFNESWTSGLALHSLGRNMKDEKNAWKGVWNLPLTTYPVFNFFPSAAPPSLTYSLASYFLDWLAHPNYDAYWKRDSIEEHFSDITVPALHVAAWYDIFLGGSLRNYAGIKLHGGSETARKGQHLLIVIGGHAGSGRKIGDVDFGAAAEGNDVDDGRFGNETVFSWYDYLFKGMQNGFAGKPVKIFVMGINQWREEDDWPPPRSHDTKYFLHSAGKANSALGDGSLSTTPSRSEAADQFVYDPKDPVPTVGGPLCCEGTHLPPGPRDQRAVEARPDVLVYSTLPLAQDVEVTGPVRVELYVKSSAVDTDFTGKLVDVWPDGFAQNLTDNIIRLRYRNSQEKPELANPGQVYPLNLDLMSTSNVFRKGHILRLEISSSNFPRFDRNLNSGEEGATAQRSVLATNAVLHDAEHPSALILSAIAARP